MSGLFDDWDSFVDALVRQNDLLAVITEVYFDESGTHAGSPMMTMAGYVFRKDHARKFSRDWSLILRKYGLSAAHMTDCANGNGEYSGMSKERRVEIEKELILHTKRRTSVGFSISVIPSDYREVMGERSEFFSAYSLLLMLACIKVRDWAESVSYKGKIAYFFESGHEHASEANRYMNSLKDIGGSISDHLYYFAHAFVDKKHAPPLQCADLLAWLHRNYLIKLTKGIDRPRKDLIALARPVDLQSHVGRNDLINLRENMRLGVGVFNKMPRSILKEYLPGRPTSTPLATE